jgi:hypothetical protein
MSRTQATVLWFLVGGTVAVIVGIAFGFRP